MVSAHTQGDTVNLPLQLHCAFSLRAVEWVHIGIATGQGGGGGGGELHQFLAILESGEDE